MRGRLLIFFGMAYGCGKIRRMLEEGQRRRSSGRDVVIGLLDRGRGLPASSIHLERVPPLAEEADTEVLARRAPVVVLIEGLAGTNRKGTNR